MRESTVEEEYKAICPMSKESEVDLRIGYSEKENYRNYKPLTHNTAFLLQK